MFVVEKLSSYGRAGRLFTGFGSELSTPLLFPVVSMVTGTTPRGGGVLKYILQANKASLLRRNLPVMTQVLHFLNFIPNKPTSFQKWRDLSIRGRYNSEISPSPNYSAPMFLDSGGFQLLWCDQLDLSKYGLLVDRENGWKAILELQMDLGGNNSIIATLDYPLAPGLSSSKARRRMRSSRQNAVQTALHLQNLSDYKSFLYVAAHGQDGRSMKNYVKSVFKDFSENGLTEYPFGLAIGSLVPLRGARKNQAIVDLVVGLQQGIPDEYRSQVPIHVFGITGNLIPILAYLGVDSFDSSTYIQEARGYCYVNPDTKDSKSILGLEELTCNCRVCQERISKDIDLKKIQDALTAKTRPGGEPLPDGTYKSEYYGYLALHNLEVDFITVDNTRKAIEENCLQDYLIEYVEKLPSLKPTLETIAQKDASLKKRLDYKGVLVKQLKRRENGKQRQSPSKVTHRNYTSKAFNILSNGYQPPKDKRILLIVPCSGDKPYSQSHSHRFIQGRLAETLGERVTNVHKVTLSGLYGPVPEEYENEPPVLGYNFRLEAFDKTQINLVSERLCKYIQRFHGCYDVYIGYATSKAYRTALEQVAQEAHLEIFPKEPKARRMTEMFRQENISELLEYITSVISDL